MNIQAAIKQLTERGDMSRDAMTAVMRDIMSGEATPAQVGGFLIALRMKGETVDEITAAAGVMRELATKIELDKPYLVDTCGTGGDGASTFNISTAVTFVVAAAGGNVAKHGNRSVSSSSGSADLLEAAGVNLALTPEQVKTCIDKLGVGFLFAPMYHSAMKHAIGPRKEMAVRTVFNLLGPLTNPASAPNQVLGVFAKKWLEPLAYVLKNLGSRHVLVVNADDGLDEISIGSATNVCELKDGAVLSYQIIPEQFGLQRADIAELAVDNAEQSLAKINEVFNNTVGPALDIVLLNSGAAIYAAGLTDTMQAGVDKARECIADGGARRKLAALIETSNEMGA